MSKFSDTKAKWQRFNQWERNFILRETIMSFPVVGTLEEFEQRFRFLLPSVPRKEFYNWDYEYSRFGNRAYFEDGEIGLLTSHPILSFLSSGVFALIWTQQHEFYGRVEDQKGQLTIRGSTVSPHIILNLLVIFLNFFLAIAIIMIVSGVVLLLWRTITGSPFDGYIVAIAFLLFGPLVAVIGFGAVFLLGSFFMVVDRAASFKIRRLLEEACGNPAQETIK